AWVIPSIAVNLENSSRGHLKTTPSITSASSEISENTFPATLNTRHSPHCFTTVTWGSDRANFLRRSSRMQRGSGRVVYAGGHGWSRRIGLGSEFVGQGKASGELRDAFLRGGNRCGFTIGADGHEHGINGVGDFLHLGLFQAAGGHGR